MKGLKEIYPWLIVKTVPLWETVCGYENVLYIDRDPDLTGNGNWVNMAPLSMSLGEI